MSQTMLLTGGAGFIGSHIAVELLQDGYDVVIADDLSNSRADVIDRIEKITAAARRFTGSTRRTARRSRRCLMSSRLTRRYISRASRRWGVGTEANRVLPQQP